MAKNRGRKIVERDELELARRRKQIIARRKAAGCEAPESCRWETIVVFNTALRPLSDYEARAAECCDFHREAIEAWKAKGAPRMHPIEVLLLHVAAWRARRP